MTVQNKLLEVLVCPACKGSLVQVRWKEPSGVAPSGATSGAAPSGATSGDAPLLALDCPQCRLRYPIVDDIPVMLVDQAERIPS